MHSYLESLDFLLNGHLAHIGLIYCVFYWSLCGIIAKLQQYQS